MTNYGLFINLLEKFWENEKYKRLQYFTTQVFEIADKKIMKALQNSYD